MSKEGFFTERQRKTARFAKALGHPVRVYIIQLLSEKSCCYSSDLSEELPIAKSTLSQHLKELKNTGLIQGTIEPPKIRYCLNEKNWKLVQELMKELLKM